MIPSGPSASTSLPRRVRELFAARLAACLDPLAAAIGARLIELVDRSASTREAQERRDATLEFERLRSGWLARTREAVQRASRQPARPVQAPTSSLSLELIDDDVVEKKIIASRLAMAIQEKASFELNDLRVRMQHLEAGAELASDDILRPETISLVLIDQWMCSQLPRQTWLLVGDVIQQHVVPTVVEAYRAINKALIAAGVLPQIDLSARVRGGGAPASRRPGAAAGASAEGDGATASGAGSSHHGSGPASGYGTAGMHAEGGNSGMGGLPAGNGVAGAGPRPGGGGPGAPGGSGFGSLPRAPGGYAGAGAGGGPGGLGGGGGYVSGGAEPLSGAFADQVQGSADARAMGSASPLARARARAQGVFVQLRRLLSDSVAGYDAEQAVRPSPSLSRAMSQQSSHLATQVHPRAFTDDGIPVYDDAAVHQAAVALRERTGELKKQATTSSEKALIEVVALMFQHILAEERIPPAVRVWFARLQMPVLRVALGEPEFFGSLQHPARQLIDRMGACVLGFDAASIGGSALEAEIRRVVQLIEQYPDTGRQVFLLAYQEFQQFLSRFLTERQATQRLVSVAQQVEQKETMTVRYTIELRNMLEGVPVRDEVRDFLFKVWAEVLAVAAVREGPQHAETLALKKSAAELIWAVSAKPNKSERAEVIQGLPDLLQRLRRGMSLMGMEGPEQERHIKAIGDTLADAFQSKTAAIPKARIDEIAKRLANLEDFVDDGADGDLPLDAESIELMLGIDASEIEVVTDGGAVKPSAAMQAWARELQPGTWFSLDHNGKVQQVQYAWRSDRGHLHLFAAASGMSFLVQVGRLAAYLQAGLLLPSEEEALTVRATRGALAKLDANPERLLA